MTINRKNLHGARPAAAPARAARRILSPRRHTLLTQSVHLRVTQTTASCDEGGLFFALNGGVFADGSDRSIRGDAPFVKNNNL